MGPWGAGRRLRYYRKRYLDFIDGRVFLFKKNEEKTNLFLCADWQTCEEAVERKLVFHWWRINKVWKPLIWLNLWACESWRTRLYTSLTHSPTYDLSRWFLWKMVGILWRSGLMSFAWKFFFLQMLFRLALLYFEDLLRGWMKSS